MESGTAQRKSSSHASRILLLCLVVLFLLLAGAFVLYIKNPSKLLSESTDKSCTLEAKLCPDGTSVGRTGPSCTFAPCPAPNNSEWKTFESKEYKYSISYPGSHTAQITQSENGTIQTQFVSPIPKDTHAILPQAYEVTISLFPKTSGQNLRTWIDEVTTIELDGKKESLLTDTVKPYTAGTNTGFYFTGGAEKISKHVFFDSGRYFVEFTLSGNATGSDYKAIPSAEESFDKMLATFKKS